MEPSTSTQIGSHQPHTPGLNFFVDGEGPTTSIISAVLSHITGADKVALKLAERAVYDDYLAHPTIFSRVCSPSLAWLPRALVGAGARYAFYLDDNLWEFQSDSDLGKYYARSDVQRSLNAFVGHAATVIVNSELLAMYVRQRFPGLRVARVPAPFDFSKLPAEGDIVQRNNHPLRVGYAGTGRGDAFSPVTAAIEHMLREMPGEIEFEFIGYVPSSLNGVHGVSTFAEIADYEEFLAFKRSRRWDAALAPLSGDVFSSAKTNNKYREYGAMGIVGLYSATGPYPESVSHGVNGLLVKHGEDNWRNALLWLVEHRELLASIGARAREDVWRKHRTEVVAEEWHRALEEARLRTCDSALGSLFAWTAKRFWGELKGRVGNYSQLASNEGFPALINHLGRKLKE